MKKCIITMLLAMSGCIWTMSEALCIARAPQMQQQEETISGTFTTAVAPCEPEYEECPTCSTLAFSAGNILYYLTSDDDRIMAKLEEIEENLHTYKNIQVSITGIPYKRSFDYINVIACEDIDIMLSFFSPSYAPSVTKLLRNGQIFIQRGGKTFNATGAEVK